MNVLSELMRPAPSGKVVAWLGRAEPALAMPTIAIAEMAYGFSKLTEGRRRDQLDAAVRRETAGLDLIDPWISSTA